LAKVRKFRLQESKTFLVHLLSSTGEFFFQGNHKEAIIKKEKKYEMKIEKKKEKNIFFGRRTMIEGKKKLVKNIQFQGFI